MKISGFGELNRQLEDAQKALSELDGELGIVKFTPDDPSSIENAIHEMEKIIDSRMGQYASNPIIEPLIVGLKEQYREGIIERAAAARLEESEE